MHSVARSGHLFVTLASRRPDSVAVFIRSINGRVSDGHSSAEALQATDDSFRELIQVRGWAKLVERRPWTIDFSTL